VFYSVNHLVQTRGCAFHVEMFVLSRSAFRSQHSTTVNFLEVAIGKFVSPLGLRILLKIEGVGRALPGTYTRGNLQVSLSTLDKLWVTPFCRFPQAFTSQRQPVTPN
jgi:hypothetical protein